MLTAFSLVWYDTMELNIQLVIAGIAKQYTCLCWLFMTHFQTENTSRLKKIQTTKEQSKNMKDLHPKLNPQLCGTIVQSWSRSLVAATPKKFCTNMYSPSPLLGPLGEHILIVTDSKT